MPEEMSAYRHIKHEGTSFSATLKYNFEKSENWAKELCMFSKKINNKQSLKLAKLLYLRNLMIAVKQGDCDKKEVPKYFKSVGCNIGTVYLYVKCWIKHHIFHSKLWV